MQPKACLGSILPCVGACASLSGCVRLDLRGLDAETADAPKG